MKNGCLFVLTFISCILFSNGVYTQDHGIWDSGEIDFEKKVNIYKVLDEFYSDDHYPQMKQFAIDYRQKSAATQSSFFTLSFNDSLTSYKPTTVNGSMKPPTGKFLSLMAFGNSVFSNLVRHQSLTKKEILGQEYLIRDSLKRIVWKIVDEQREIAGFNCRRANGIFMDSIYVVAFYTDQIMTPGGPESFTGLPGMILELAIPYYHVSWFATDVRKTKPILSDILLTRSGKALVNKDLEKFFADEANFKDGGKHSEYNIVMGLL